MNGQYVTILKPDLTGRTLYPFVMLVPGLKVRSFNAMATIRIRTPILV